MVLDLLGAFENLLESIHQLEEGQLRQWGWLRRRLDRNAAREHVSPQHAAPPQLLGRLLVLLILEQSTDQLRARIFLLLGQLVLFRVWIGR